MRMPKVIEGYLVDDAKIQKPFRLIVAGGSGSGKTEFVKKLVHEDFFTSSFDHILYIYPDYLEECPTEFQSRANVQYLAGLPSQEFLGGLEPNTLVVLDDMMLETAKSETISKLFTVIARKRQISIILLVQNIFQQGVQFRTIRLNATAIVLFKFYAGVDSNYRLLRDLGLLSFIPKVILENIYSTRYRYIYLDLHPNRQFDYSTIRSNIFDNYSRIYYKMEYVAIPKADFLKYFKIIKNNKGKVRALKNEIEIKQKAKRRKRERSPTPESVGSTTDISTDSD